MDNLQNLSHDSVITLAVSPQITAKSRFAELLIGGLLLLLALGGFVM